MKSITGTSEAAKGTAKAQKVMEAILRKEGTAIFGGSDDENDHQWDGIDDRDDFDDEDGASDLEVQDTEGGFYNLLFNFNFLK